ncbi:MAG TPA: hypothetical protein VIL04_10820 [Solirubrobacterales bacterium]|jgi:polyhydroxyalkanoate synthesis regulator phasin
MAADNRKANRSSSGGSSTRGDRSIEAFREALERSITLSRDRLQEVVDDAVKRGRMTRSDANELVSRLVARGRSYSDELLKDLERLVEQARRSVEPQVKLAASVASEATRRAREAADHAERLRRRARGAKPSGAKERAATAAKPGSANPIPDYASLNATQVRARLKDLSDADLRKVRAIEEKGKARKTVLAEIDRRLSS